MRVCGCTDIKVKFKPQVQVEHKLYEHIHRYQISMMIVNAIRRGNDIHVEEDSEDEHVRFELAGFCDYD